jgi:hypothetical protein
VTGYVLRHGKRIAIETLRDNVVPLRKPIRRRKNFIHEDLETLILGLDPRGRVWTYLLQQRRMQPGKSVVVSNIQMAKFDVSRYAKTRALLAFEKAGLIRLERDGKHSLRVKVLK